MAAAVELATAYVTLAVDSSSISKEIGKGFSGGDKVAARSGSSMGQSMRKAFSASKPLDVGAASKNLEAAQDRLAQHTERSASKQQAAQEAVAAARQKVADVATKSSEKVTAAQTKLEAEEANLARVTAQSARDQESAKRKVELAQAKYNDTVAKYGPESTQALGAANKLADAEDRLAKTTSDGAAKQEAAKRKVANAQEQYTKAVKESGADSAAARKAADDLTVAEQQLEAASKEAATGHEKLSAEVESAKVAFDKASKSSSGLGRVWSKAKDFGADYVGMGQRLNKAIGPKIWSGVKLGALGAAGAIGGTLAGAVVKGFGRLSSIENAEAKLKGLGHSAKDVSSIMDNALAAVKGTAFGMDEAATLSGTLVASGIKPGKELEKTLRLTADSATIAGKGLDDMGLIWGSVAAKGKLQGDDAMQLLASGVPIWQMVGDVMGKTAGEAQELGSKGQVSFEIFQKAMEKGVGGAALEAGNTTQGAFKNMNAALSRFGAALLKDIYPAIAPVLGKVTDLFDYLTDAAGPAMESFLSGLKPFADGIKGVFDILANGDYTGAENLFGFEEDSGFVDFLFTVRDAAIALYDKALKPLGAWFASNWKPIAAAVGGVLAYLGGSMIVAGVAALGSAIAGLSIPFTAIGALIAAVVGGLAYFFTQTKTGQQVIANVFSAIQTAVGAVVSFFTGTVWPALLTGWDVLKAVVSAVWNGAIKPVFTAIASLAQQVFTGVIIPALQQFGGYIVGTIWPIIQKLWTDYIQPIFTLIGGIAVWLWNTVLQPAFSAMAFYYQNVLGPVIVWLWKNVVSPAFTAIGAIIGGIFTGVVFPILDAFKVLLVDVIAPAAVWLWKNAIVPAFNGIKAAVLVVADWFMDTLVPFLGQVWSAIGTAVSWLGGVFSAIWSGIKVAVSVVADWVTGTLVPVLAAAWSAIGTAASWLYTNIIQPVWTAIKTIIAVVITAVLLQVKAWVWFFQNVVAPVFTWLYKNVIKPVWNAIKTAIGVVVTWFQDTVWPILSKVIGYIQGRFLVLRLKLLESWAAIRDKIIAPVVAWFRDTAWPIIQRVIGYIRDGFNAMKNALSAAWKFVKNNVIAPVIAWFRDTAWPIIRSVIDAIKSAFTVMRDKLSAGWSFVKNSVIKPVVTWFRDTAKTIFTNTIDKIKSSFTGLKDRLSSLWSSIKTKIIKPVADWFRDTIKPLFDTAVDGIKDAFSSLKSAIKKAWNGIRDTAKTPVEFVVKKVINGAIIDTYNDVANGMFGLDKISHVSLPSGWARGGVLPGYTPMHKGDDVLTPMRSGEGVLVSEGLRDRRSKRLFLGANEAAKRGTSFADYVGSGYAGGGLVKLGMPFAGTYGRGEGFGARGGKHKGIDFPMPQGATLKAVAAGTVSHSWNPSAGKKLELSIGNGLVAGYHHLSSYIAGRGDSVGRGSDIARVGSTGHSTGPHLHFSIKKDGTYVDPAPYIGAAGGEAGEGKSSWWNPFSGLWSSIKSTLRDGVGDTAWGDALFQMPKKLVDGAVEWAKDKLSSALDLGGGGGGGADQWSALASQALNMTGQYSASNLSSMLRRLNQESGGDPNAINKWDSNYQRGTPSKGLMQVIDPTFRAYAMSGYDTNIWDPLSNMLASIRYAVATYGSLSAAYNRSGGYAGGGIVKPFLHDNGGRLDPGVSVIANKTRKPEAILTDAQWRTMHQLAEQNLASDGGPSIYIENAGLQPADVAREIKKTERQKAALRPRVRS